MGPVKKNVLETRLHMAIKRDPSKKCVVRGHRKVGQDGRLTFFVSVITKLYMHALGTGSAAGPLTWSEIDPALQFIKHSTRSRAPAKRNYMYQRLGLSSSVLGKNHENASGGFFVNGYVRLLQSQYESKSARTVLKILKRNFHTV